MTVQQYLTWLFIGWLIYFFVRPKNKFMPWKHWATPIEMFGFMVFWPAYVYFFITVFIRGKITHEDVTLHDE